MSDPVADMMLEAEQDAEAERIARQNVEERLSSVERQLAELVALVRGLPETHNGSGKTFTVTGRDEHERIKTVRIGD